MKPAIAVLAFNRPEAFARLLSALQAAEYPQKPKLVLSLEGQAHPDVVRLAKDFRSDKLDICVLERKERLGLRDHVIACGDLTKTYGSVIVLEDDLLVDRYFYAFATEALRFYDQDDTIAGVSLYSYDYSEFSKLPFRPMKNGYSTYFMQVVSSWGQCWTQRQWQTFRLWYSGKTADDLKRIARLPPTVKAWPESSWKKYFHGYLVETNKYFVYPYCSYSTNCSDAGGVHIQEKVTDHQVALPSPNRPAPTFDFCPSDCREVVYDAFMEPCGQFVERALGMTAQQFEIDIQASKPLSLLKSKLYSVTPRSAGQTLQLYDLDFRPPEFNLLFPNSGQHPDFWLCESETLNDENMRETLDRYKYYAKMPLMRIAIIAALFRSVVAKILKKGGLTGVVSNR